LFVICSVTELSENWNRKAESKAENLKIKSERRPKSPKLPEAHYSFWQFNW